MGEVPGASSPCESFPETENLGEFLLLKQRDGWFELEDSE
jgi:hypothetical protein